MNHSCIPKCPCDYCKDLVDKPVDNRFLPCPMKSYWFVFEAKQERIEVTAVVQANLGNPRNRMGFRRRLCKECNRADAALHRISRQIST